jgi:hypothetical protein
MKIISNLFNRDRVQQPVKLLSNKTALLSSLLLFSIFLCTTNATFARDVCKDVKITIKNGTKDTVNVTKFEYFDVDKNKFRTENFFGGVDGLTVSPNKSSATTRNLQHVGNDLTSFKVTYRRQINGENVGASIVNTTLQFKCVDGVKKSFLLNGSNNSVSSDL